MSAMPKFVADYREVYVGQVREIQARYPKSHQALKNWGTWSRELHGIFPQIAQPGWTAFYKAQEGDYAEEATDIPTNVVELPVKAEREAEAHSDERSGIELDVRIHALHFPTIWRRVLKAAYVTTDTPEYQFPRVAKCGADGFLVFLDSALANLEKQLG